MKHPMRHLRRAGLVLALTQAPAACVTINVYFPAAAAERAADRIIDEVYQLRRDGSAPAPAAKPATPAPAK